MSDGGLLRAETLRFAEEVRSPGEVDLPRRAKAPAKGATRLARAIAGLKRKSLDVDELSDRYAEKLHQLAEKKARQGRDVVHLKGAEAEAEAPEEGGNVVDLMKVLREKLAGQATVGTAAPAPAGERAAPRAAHGRRAPRRARPGARRAARKPAHRRAEHHAR